MNDIDIYPISIPPKKNQVESHSQLLLKQRLTVKTKEVEVTGIESRQEK